MILKPVDVLGITARGVISPSELDRHCLSPHGIPIVVLDVLENLRGESVPNRLMELLHLLLDLRYMLGKHLGHLLLGLLHGPYVELHLLLLALGSKFQ